MSARIAPSRGQKFREPFKRAIKPPPFKRAVKPPPFKRAVKPPPFKNAFKPSPFKKAFKSSPFKKADKPPLPENAMLPPTAQLTMFQYRNGRKSAYLKEKDEYIYRREKRLSLLTIERMTTKYPRGKGAAWRQRLGTLHLSEGWTQKDITNWAAILRQQDADALIERLVNSERPIPLFLAMWALNRNQIIRKPKSVIDLLRWCKRYINEHHSQSASHWRQIPPKVFLSFLAVLGLHIGRLCPASLVGAAVLTCDYIRSLAHAKDGYAKQCEAFNGAIVIFSRRSYKNPITNFMYNWSAQKTLLALSDSLEKPLIIDRESYRAIRQVVIAQRKTRAEAGRAFRYGKTWPPYGKELDGMDARRSSDDNHSDSMKVGFLAREAGYSDGNVDRAQSVLGGTDKDGSPTIQTRQPLPEWHVKSRIKQHEDPHKPPPLTPMEKKQQLSPAEEKQQRLMKERTMYWAMRVRATRNAHEAWQRFRQARVPPSANLYAEMFLKLFAAPVPEGAQALPGDTKENFPFHDANYSEYELARMAPPSVKTLYEDMIRSGVTPWGHCLAVLLLNASSVEDGLQYLKDSGLPPHIIESLSMSDSRPPTSWRLSGVSPSAFTSYIALLCRLQPDRRQHEEIDAHSLHHVRHAISLVSILLTPGTTLGKTYRPPWLWIFRELARPNIAVKNGSKLENDLEACSLFVKVLYRAVRTVGMDADMFMYLCRIAQKVSRTRMATDSTREDTANYLPIQKETESLLADMFVTMTSPGASRLEQYGMIGKRNKTLAVKHLSYHDYPDTWLQETFHRLHPSHFHAYMRSLAYWDNMTDMVNLFRWIVLNRRHVETAALWQGTKRGPLAIRKTIWAFQVLAAPHLERALLTELDRLLTESEPGPEGVNVMESYWQWATPEQVEEYIKSDETGGTAMLVSRRAPPQGPQHPIMRRRKEGGEQVNQYLRPSDLYQEESLEGDTEEEEDEMW